MAVKKWEYKVFFYHGSKAEQTLNALGSEGWELIAASGGSLNDGGSTCFLKREKR